MRNPPAIKPFSAATRAAIAASESREAAEVQARRAENVARARAIEESEVRRRTAAVKAHQQLVDARRQVEDCELDFEAEVIRVRCAGEGHESAIEVAEGRLARARRELGIAQLVARHWQSPGFR